MLYVPLLLRQLAQRMHARSVIPLRTTHAHMPAKPTPRQLHSSVILEGSIYFFGGFDEAGEFKNDLFTYNLGKQVWKKQSTSTKIKGRHSHTAVEHNAKMYVYGGVHAGQELNDLFRFSPTENAWKEITTNKSVPPRWGHSAVVHGNSMFIYGGTTNGAAVDEIWCFNFETNAWTSIEPKSDVKPPARRYHVSVAKDGYMYVLGGLANNNNLSDFWRFDLETHVWEKLPEGPAGGCRGQVAIDFKDLMIVHGGKQKSHTLGDVYSYSYATRQWKKLNEWQTEPTYFHSGVVWTNKIYLFGGLVHAPGATKSTCSDKLSILQPILRSNESVLLLTLPKHIISNHICKYLDLEDLGSSADTCAGLRSIIDELPLWETLARAMLPVTDEPTNWRTFYLSQARYKYFHLTDTKDKKFIHNPNLDVEIKAAIFGDCGVGKTSLFYRYWFNGYIEDHDPTFEDDYRRNVTFEERTFLLDLFDAAGPEEFTAMQDYFMRVGNVFIIAFDITNKASFDWIQGRYDLLLDVSKKENPNLIIVGTKADLENKRVVSRELAEQLTKRLHGKYFETSAKENINVMEMFAEVFWMQARREYTKGGKVQSKNCTMM